MVAGKKKVRRKMKIPVMVSKRYFNCPIRLIGRLRFLLVTVPIHCSFLKHSTLISHASFPAFRSSEGKRRAKHVKTTVDYILICISYHHTISIIVVTTSCLEQTSALRLCCKDRLEEVPVGSGPIDEDSLTHDKIARQRIPIA